MDTINRDENKTGYTHQTNTLVKFNMMKDIQTGA